MINAFSQLGNVAGSYVWNLSANGYRKSYGIVTAMFGVTIVGCFVFRLVLMRMNKRLDEEEGVVVSSGGGGSGKEQGEEEVDEKVERVDDGGERGAERMSKGFRYLV